MERFLTCVQHTRCPPPRGLRVPAAFRFDRQTNQNNNFKLNCVCRATPAIPPLPTSDVIWAPLGFNVGVRPALMIDPLGEVRMVEDVEHLRPDLEGHPLVDLRHLGHAKVRVRVAGSAQIRSSPDCR